MSTATQGRSREYKVRDHLIDKGYPFIMRAAASKGAGDLLHGHPQVGALLVQVGTGNKTLGPEARMRFLGAAALINALPILATVVARSGARTEITYWCVTNETSSKWERWSPDTYDSLDEFNAEVATARAAYIADELVREGYCENDCGRKKDGTHRQCGMCRKAGRP